MKNNHFSIPALLVAACLAAPIAGWAQSTSHIIIATPDELKWSDFPLLPGAQIAVIEGKMDKKGPIIARIKLPADAKVAPHWHPGIERVTVLSGTFNYGMGDKLEPEKTRSLGPGSVIVMQPKMHHFAWTKEETVVQLNVEGPWGITYVNPADDPRKK
ncbi:cupin domain-containing protein [Burkholderia sp. Bp9142]|uniref:cupin domain-containing protein n=1 Tax=Burkholderia sp. Bp9142 TaxID=2184573 RepID=UPI001626989E|nr:cupin domain-containing protein [Burkholderia sp. Bp9142]